MDNQLFTQASWKQFTSIIQKNSSKRETMTCQELTAFGLISMYLPNFE